ncbi:MAG: hypothetical protein RLY49_246 [Candidatus Parcubacteria bacterium]|jgi:hypothetical protein
MKKKLSQEERKEVVTKGFLVDNGYLTEKRFEELFDKKSRELLMYYQEDMKHHIESLMEQQKDYFHAIIEVLSGRFEKNEEEITKLDMRVKQIERKYGF